MRRLLLPFIVIALLLPLGDAWAGPQAGGAAPGDIGIFFVEEPATGGDAREVALPFEPFDIFVVSFDVPGGMEAYEFGITVPMGMLVSGGRLLPPGATDFGAGDDNWIVGTGGNCIGAVGSFALVRYAAALFLAPVGLDVPICLTPATPTSFSPPSPGYLVCESPGDLRPFTPAYVGCAELNDTDNPCCPVGTESESFGALKARF